MSDANEKNNPKAIPVKDWIDLPEDDIRRIYADGPPETVYDRLKEKGVIVDLGTLLGEKEPS